jgi:phosphopantothenoylcysteine decarboxylase/phosphopantothenate--cysteine ligase
MTLSGKNILLGITGSIAAYKAAELIRLLVKEGASVQVVMSPCSRDFITPLTLSTLSKNRVLSEFSDPHTGEWENHVNLGLEADLIIIAPATAGTISKLAHGNCDNLLIATYLSARCPVWIAPAMDHDMYRHGSTQQNISKLRSFGNRILEPGKGELASGLIGEGRLQEPAEICSQVVEYFSRKKASKLAGKKILITAGPTREPIDPVRFISNHSSGKMGVAIANEASKRGGEVTLIHGPGIDRSLIIEGISISAVTSAHDMYEAVTSAFSEYDICLMAAAVADYAPSSPESEKIKKSENNSTVELTPTRDILKQLGTMKSEEQILVGFALETENELANAEKKLHSKNLDMIVLNSLRDEGAGFNTDTNKITIIDAENTVTGYDLKSKSEVASDILDKVEEKMK